MRVRVRVIISRDDLVRLSLTFRFSSVCSSLPLHPIGVGGAQPQNSDGRARASKLISCNDDDDDDDGNFYMMSAQASKRDNHEQISARARVNLGASDERARAFCLAQSLRNFKRTFS